MAADGLVGAIVLTGGLSTRMGTDKATLVVNGQRLVDRTIGVLAQAQVSTVAIAGSAEVPDPESAPGQVSSQGPLAGIVGGWRHLRRLHVDPVVVLACDLPALSPAIVRLLIHASHTVEHGAVAHDGERPQPLIAAYRPAALDALEAAFGDGERSVRRCFNGWELATVAFDPIVLSDADTPEDLEGFDVQWPS